MDQAQIVPHQFLLYKFHEVMLKSRLIMRNDRENGDLLSARTIAPWDLDVGAEYLYAIKLFIAGYRVRT